MKNILLTLLKEIKEDATFLVYHYNKNEILRTEFKGKSFVYPIIKEAKEVSLHENYDDIVLVNGIGISLECFSENVQRVLWDM